MPKKLTKEDVVEEAEKALSTLDVDFHREDLNLLRDKLNEVVARLNS